MIIIVLETVDDVERAQKRREMSVSKRKRGSCEQLQFTVIESLVARGRGMNTCANEARETTRNEKREESRGKEKSSKTCREKATRSLSLSLSLSTKDRRETLMWCECALHKYSIHCNVIVSLPRGGSFPAQSD